MVQWLDLVLPHQEAQVPSLVGEPRLHMLCGMTKNKVKKIKNSQM